MAKGGGGGVHAVAVHAHRVHQALVSVDCFCSGGCVSATRQPHARSSPALLVPSMCSVLREAGGTSKGLLGGRNQEISSLPSCSLSRGFHSGGGLQIFFSQAQSRPLFLLR